MKIINWIAYILLIIGGLNWGLIGLADTNVITMVLGGTGIERVLYILVGLSAVWTTFCCLKSCKTCS